MLNLDSFSVSFNEGNIQDFLKNATWNQCSSKQKEDFLDEMQNANNQFAIVNVFPQRKMIELSFKRNFSDYAFVAGKWVELQEFDSFHLLAYPFRNCNNSN